MFCPFYFTENSFSLKLSNLSELCRSALMGIWNFIEDHSALILFIVTIMVIVYIIETLKYTYKLLRYANIHTVNLGQITIEGELSKVLTPEQVALFIQAEFNSINQCLESMRKEKVESYPAEPSSVDYYFFFTGTTKYSNSQNALKTAAIYQRLVIPKIDGIANNPILQTNISIGIGSLKIPLSDIYRSMMSLIGALPVFPRIRYLKSIINISITSYEKNAKVIVFREKAIVKNGQPLSSETSLSSVKTMDEINSLLRDTTFMVLGLHKAFKYHWKSMRYLLDGFIEFTSFRNSGELIYRNNAKDFFEKALKTASENNLEAMFYVSVMLMVERTDIAIEKAITYFEIAKKSTKDRRFQSFINLGLAFCYAQSYHRLGKKGDETITKACNSIKEVEDYWENTIKKKATDSYDLPLIPYMRAMLKFVQASDTENIEKKEELFNEALEFAYKSTTLDENNSMFKNNIGWALMMLAKSGIEKLRDGILKEETERNTVLLSERYLNDALILNPKNTLTHANLCLLYSLPYFVKKNEEQPQGLIYLKARFHGLEAVALDKNYINGYRDLCLTYIRYGRVKEAEECFYKALELAINPCKDAEIFMDVLNEAKKEKIDEDTIKRWSDPKPEYFEPIYSGSSYKYPTSETRNKSHF